MVGKKAKQSKTAKKAKTVKKKGAAAKKSSAPEFAIQRLYVKDLSFEAPNSPAVFLDEWKPELNMDLSTKAEPLGEGAHNVVLTVTVTVKIKEKVAFLIEVQQGGIFTMTDFPEDQLRPMLGSFCPNILYPYAREAVTDAAIRGGFPQLYLAPVNFDALYQQHEEEGQVAEAAK